MGDVVRRSSKFGRASCAISGLQRDVCATATVITESAQPPWDVSLEKENLQSGVKRDVVGRHRVCAKTKGGKVRI